MNVFIVLSFLAFALSETTAKESAYVPEICKENKGNFEVLEATYFQENFIVYGQNKRTFSISNFTYTGNGSTPFTSNGVQEQQQLDWMSRLRLSFPMEVNKSIHMIAIEYDQDDALPQYVGWYFTRSFQDKYSINVNFYKYTPGESNWNLGQLWKNFPQIEIQDRLLSLSPFPFYSDTNLPQRYFAYYKELPPVSTTDCSDCYEMLRFVMVLVFKNHTDDQQTAPELQVYNEPTYEVDPLCAPCDNLDGLIVNASSFLSTSYEKTAEGTYTFPWIEFFGLNYRILKITVLTNKSVSNEKPILREGVVGEIFGCNQTEPSTTTTEPSTTQAEVVPGPNITPIGNGSTTKSSNKSNATPSPEPSTSSSSTWMIVGIVFFLLVVAIVAIALWMTFANNPEPTSPTTTGRPQAVPSNSTQNSDSQMSKSSDKPGGSGTTESGSSQPQTDQSAPAEQSPSSGQPTPDQPDTAAGQTGPTDQPVSPDLQDQPDS